MVVILAARIVPSKVDGQVITSGCLGMKPDSEVSVMTRWRRDNPERALDYQRKYESENREDINRKRRAYRKRNPNICRAQWLRQKCGVSLEWYDAKFDEQEGKCAICGAPSSSKQKRLAVDHCHTTGNNRGLLCFRCNTVLEKVESMPDFFERAVEYLKKYEV